MLRRLLGIWVIWRVGRVLLPLVVLAALIGALAASAHHPSPLPDVPSSVQRATDHAVTSARRDLTHRLERHR